MVHIEQSAVELDVVIGRSLDCGPALLWCGGGRGNWAKERAGREGDLGHDGMAGWSRSIGDQVGEVVGL